MEKVLASNRAALQARRTCDLVPVVPRNLDIEFLSRFLAHRAVNEGDHSQCACHRRLLGCAGTGSALVARLPGRVYGPLLGFVAVDASIATAAGTSVTSRRTAQCEGCRQAESVG